MEGYATANILLRAGSAQTRLQAYIDGDSLSLSIAAASIIAKVTRDTLMTTLHEQYPHYGFDTHVCLSPIWLLLTPSHVLCPTQKTRSLR